MTTLIGVLAGFALGAFVFVVASDLLKATQRRIVEKRKMEAYRTQEEVQTLNKKLEECETESDRIRARYTLLTFISRNPRHPQAALWRKTTEVREWRKLYPDRSCTDAIARLAKDNDKLEHLLQESGAAALPKEREYEILVYQDRIRQDLIWFARKYPSHPYSQEIRIHLPSSRLGDEGNTGPNDLLSLILGAS